MLTKIDQNFFKVIIDDCDSFDQDLFIARYSEILDKYDYVVGDYGYEQLRLKGFYNDSNKKTDVSKRFSAIQDYLLEYCNFGCKYFVVKKLSKSEVSMLTSEEGIFVDEKEKLDNVKIQPSIQQNSKQDNNASLEEDSKPKNTLNDYLS